MNLFSVFCESIDSSHLTLQKNTKRLQRGINLNLLLARISVSMARESGLNIEPSIPFLKPFESRSNIQC